MIETVSTQLKAIAFEHDIKRLTEGFTGREWVFKEIDRWLQQENQRFFILTGEPGVGKSAITARLTQIRDDVVAYHFCRAGDVETVRTGRILRSLAAQLGKHLPDYGHALANTIKPVHLRIEVNINIGSMTGSEVTGVYIKNLKASDPENELDILIRAPLEELQRMYAERQQTQPALAIILIDSLDEAVTTTGTNLVKLLTQLSKSTSLPSWVRFVMTSRPERRVLRGFEPLKPYQLREKSDESLSDIRRYVNDRVAQPALQNCLQVNQVQPQTLINNITNLSHGNFLYTTLLLNDIEAGRQALDNLAALPKSIDDIYHSFLSRFSEEDWSKLYKPIFGILLIALEPISEEQILNFTKIDSEDVRYSIRIASQFFDVETDEQNKEIYSIFHQSLRDYLLDKDRNLDFWCDALKQHQRIVTFYEKTSKFWQELEPIDSYGRNYLAQHLVNSDQVEKLHKLLKSEIYDEQYKQKRPAWFKVKDDKGETASFLEDLELAWSKIDTRFSQVVEKRIGLKCHYALIKSSINSLAEIPKELMIALVCKKLWKPAKALAYAHQVGEPRQRSESLIALACQLPASELHPKICQSALESTQAIKDEKYLAEALIELADKLPLQLFPEALTAAKTIQDEAVAKTIQDKLYRAKALKYLANKVLPEALAAAQAIQDNYYRTKALGYIANEYSKMLPQALEAAQAIQDEYSRTKALIALADISPDLLPQALEAAQAIQDEYSRTKALIVLAEKLPPDLLPQALEAALAMQWENYRVQILTTLGDKLPLDLLPQALEAALAIQDEYNRVRVLTALGDKLPEALPKALETAISIRETVTRAKALTLLAEKLPDLAEKLPDAYLNALTEVEGIKVDVDGRTGMAWSKAGEFLLDLVETLPPDCLSQALIAIERTDLIGGTVNRSEILKVMACNIRSWKASKALGEIERLKDRKNRAWAVAAIADQLPLEALPKALEICQLIEDFDSYTKYSIVNNLPDIFKNNYIYLWISRPLKRLWFSSWKFIIGYLKSEFKLWHPSNFLGIGNFSVSIFDFFLKGGWKEYIGYNPFFLIFAIFNILIIISLQSLKLFLMIASPIIVCLILIFGAIKKIGLVATCYYFFNVRRSKYSSLSFKALDLNFIKDNWYSKQPYSENERIIFLEKLALQLIAQTNCLQLWEELLQFLSSQTRSRFLGDLIVLAPLILVLGKKQDISEISEAVKNVTEWWP